MNNTPLLAVLLCRFAPIVAVGLAFAASSPAFAQSQERVIYASVLDERGKPVESVQPGDLQVREDDVAREVLRVVPATEPMQIAVLVDTSAALTNEVSNARDALRAFFKQMAGKHEISLVEFGDRPNILVDSTTNLALLEKGLGFVYAKKGAGAYLLDALVETSKGFQKRESERPVIVVLMTEGVEFSNASWERVLDALKASGAALHILSLTTVRAQDDLTDEIRNRNIVVDRGTSETGGRRENLLSGMAFEPAMESLADQLLHQVKVIYARPQALIPPDKIAISATRPGLTVRGTPARPQKGK